MSDHSQIYICIYSNKHRKIHLNMFIGTHTYLWNLFVDDDFVKKIFFRENTLELLNCQRNCHTNVIKYANRYETLKSWN